MTASRLSRSRNPTGRARRADARTGYWPSSTAAAGDPNIGGSRSRPLVTAYRQDALRLVRVLAETGPMPLAELRAASGIATAARILQRNVYGWFVRVGRGVYGLSARGHEALRVFADAVAALAEPAVPQREAA